MNTPHSMLFAEVLEAADFLSPEDQEGLIAILRRRLSERNRQRLADEIREALEEFAAGACQPTETDALMGEILQQ